MVSDGTYSIGTVGLWLSIGILCAKAVEAEAMRRTAATAILNVVSIGISLGMNGLHNQR
jgi:hypothetical protein